MKIIQVTENLAYGDGSSNCIFFISAILDELKYPNIILTFRLDDKIKNKHIVKQDIYQTIDADKDDIIIYHLCAGNSVNYIMENLPLKKILVYQNVTTPDFFRGIDDEAFKSCLWGVYDASRTAGKYLRSIVMSEFNKRSLIEMGWKAEDISVLPLIKTNNLDIGVNHEIVDRYCDEYANFISVGRIVPNKKIEDVIRIFSYYQKNFNHKSRLILAGNIIYQNYYEALVEYADFLKADQIIFTDRISNEDLEAYYAVSNIYLCMSEHEGFCMPLVEAMKREIPIIAYSSTAIPDTLGEAGVLVDRKDEKKVAQYIVRLLCDDVYRNEIISLQKKRLNVLSLENYGPDLKKLIEEVRQMEKYSYTCETREISVSYMMKPEAKPKPKPEIKVESQCLKDLKKISHDKENIVIYGMGKAGKKLLAECNKYERELLKKLVICDNAVGEKYFNQIPVMHHEECTKKYKKALYIVTVQNACVEIIADLISSNIEKRCIKFYNFASNKIV